MRENPQKAKLSTRDEISFGALFTEYLEKHSKVHKRSANAVSLWRFNLFKRQSGHSSTLHGVTAVRTNSPLIEALPMTGSRASRCAGFGDSGLGSSAAV
jgi:hypothetical protein